MMQIYGDLISGNCLKVKYTAEFLGLPYEWVPIDIMRGETRTDAFLTLNPGGQVPVIALDDGRTLSQSNAIIQYLASGSELLPEDAYERAKVAELLFWEQYSHEPYVAVCRFVMRYQGKSAQEREDWRVARAEAALESHGQAANGPGVVRRRSAHHRGHRPARVHASGPRRRVRHRHPAPRGSLGGTLREGVGDR